MTKPWQSESNQKKNIITFQYAWTKKQTKRASERKKMLVSKKTKLSKRKVTFFQIGAKRFVCNETKNVLASFCFTSTITKNTGKNITSKLTWGKEQLNFVAWKNVSFFSVGKPNISKQF